MKLVVVFPGWGTSKSLYQKLDLNGYKILIVDSFDKKKLLTKIKELRPIELNFIGWSMGAILALKYLNFFKVDKLILLAPTLYFLENQPKVIVKRMIKSLRRDKLETLRNFSSLNFHDQKFFNLYYQEYQEDLKKIDFNYLEKGLYFLLEENLREIEINNSISPVVIFSKNDKIIKTTSSKKVLTKFNNYTSYNLGEVGHNIIYESNYQINRIIRSCLDDKKGISKEEFL